MDRADHPCDDRPMVESDVSTALGGARERRERLAAAADGLEQAITRAPGDLPAWQQGVQAALDELRTTLVAHVDEVEAPDGLYTDISTRTPRLIHAIDRLRHDHLVLNDQVVELDGLVAADDVLVEAVRERALVLLTDISRHRHRGADLLWESYDVDIGGWD